MSSFDMSFDEYLERKQRAWEMFVALHRAGRDRDLLASELAAECFASVDEFEATANRYAEVNLRTRQSELRAK